jgi:hypothetical protein
MGGKEFSGARGGQGKEHDAHFPKYLQVSHTQLEERPWIRGSLSAGHSISDAQHFTVTALRSCSDTVEQYGTSSTAVVQSSWFTAAMKSVCISGGVLSVSHGSLPTGPVQQPD